MTRKLRKMSISVVTAFLLVGFVAAVAAAPQEEQEEMAVFEGKLLSMNLAAKTMTVENSAGEKMEFSYTEKTKIIGAADSIEELASEEGIDVKVDHDSDSIATQIEVLS